MYYKTDGGVLVAIGASPVINDVTKVSLTGNESISGTKTFSGQVVLTDINKLRVGVQHPQDDGVFTANMDGGAIMYLSSHGTSGSIIRAWNASGTPSARTAVGAGRSLLTLDGRGYGASGWRQTCSIALETDTGSFTDASMPGRIRFLTTPDGSISQVERMKIDSTGLVTMNNGLTVTGTTTLSSTTSIGNVSSTEIGYLDGVTSAIQTQLDAKAPTASPTFTGTVTLPATTTIASAWTAFTPGNSWVHFGSPYTTPAYHKDANGFVTMKGVIKSGTPNTAITTLPVGFRPTQTHYFISVAGAGFCALLVDANGVVQVGSYISSGTNAYVSLDVLRFGTF
jgi:hypothetical protein